MEVHMKIRPMLGPVLLAGLLGELARKRHDKNMPHPKMTLEEMELVSRGREKPRGIARRE
jgi:hypothetical protein